MIALDRQTLIKSLVYRAFSMAVLYAFFRSARMVLAVECVKVIQYYLFERVYGWAIPRERQ